MKLMLNLLRSLRLRCPHCGQGRLTRNYFVFNERCDNCAYVFQGDPGDFWGTVVMLYTAAGILGIATGAVLIGMGIGDIEFQIYTAAIVVAASALALFPLVKSLWIHLLYHTRGHFEEYRAPDKR
ncbi:MAG: DUF983 domain-containing protein [Candidatus Lambdaproteobacteria bacterium]|nr:DUF983 domain-containing protein [Candidatus Lambdaproteobacteria bacterium]